MKVRNWVLIFSLLLSGIGYAQTSGGGPFTHSNLSFTYNGSSACYPYQVQASTSTENIYSCVGGVLTLPIGGNGGSGNIGIGTTNSVAYYLNSTSIGASSNFTFNPTGGLSSTGLLSFPQFSSDAGVIVSDGSGNLTTNSLNANGLVSSALGYLDSAATANTPSYFNGAKILVSGSFMGNTKEFGTASGSFTNGDVVVTDTNHNIIDGGFVPTANPWTSINTHDVYLSNDGNVGIGTFKTTTAALTVMNGNVGIGTWKPGSSIDVYTSATASGADIQVAHFADPNQYMTVGIDATNASGIGQSSISFEKNGSQKWAVLDDYAGNGTLDFAIYDATNANAILYADASDNVHLGSNSYLSGGVLTISASGEVATIYSILDDGSGNAILYGGLTVNTEESSSLGSSFHVEDGNGNDAFSVNDNDGTGDVVQTVNNLLDDGSGDAILTNTVGIGPYISSTGTTAQLDVSGNDGSGNGVSIFDENHNTAGYESVRIGQDISASGASQNLSLSHNNTSFAYTDGNIVANQDTISAGGADTAGLIIFTISATPSSPIIFATNGYPPTERMRIAGAGNVGINSANPGQRLDVQGTVRMTGFSDTASPTNGYVLTSDASGTGTWKISSGAVSSVSNSDGTLTITPTTGAVVGSLTLSHANTWTGQQIFNTANVGINSTVPGQKLDVQGTVRMTGFNLSASPTNNYILTSDSSGNGTWQAAGNSSQWTTTNTKDVFLPSAGNVGIGTTFTSTSALTVMNGNVGIGTWSPTNTLNVIGGVNISGNSNPTYFNSTGGNVGIGSINPGAALDVQGVIRGISGGTCTTLYRCVGGVDAGVIQTSACVLCPGGSCTAMNGCF